MFMMSFLDLGPFYLVEMTIQGRRKRGGLNRPTFSLTVSFEPGIITRLITVTPKCHCVTKVEVKQEGTTLSANKQVNGLKV